MANPNSENFHHQSKKLNVHIPGKREEWPNDWKTTYYKTYPRLPRITLPIVRPPEVDIFGSIAKRQSPRKLSQGLTFDEISILLKYGAGIVREEPHMKVRAYPSGGARYPLEIYILITEGNQIASGLYHYDLRTHALTCLFARSFRADDIRNLFVDEWIQGAGAIILTTAIFERTQNKYGERGYRFILMDAGEINQNLYLICSALSLKCCAVGIARESDTKLEKLLDIDGVTESLVGLTAIGK